MTRKTLPAYAASFASGFRQAARDHADLASRLLIYAILILVFNAIYGAMPVGELGVPGLTRHHLLWYFAVTESITATQALYLFGGMVAEGRLTEMMQRPVSIGGMFLARTVGTHILGAGFMIAVAAVALPLFFDAHMTMDMRLAPLLVLSLFLGILMLNMLGYIIGTVEVHGAYSRPLCWIISKLVFSLGGLFFPVRFFPPLLRHIVEMTPFPSIIGTPGEFMLPLDAGAIEHGLLTQFFWLAVLMLLVVLAERRMLRHVLSAGD